VAAQREQADQDADRGDDNSAAASPPMIWLSVVGEVR
jgi:hypothetical protein